MNPISVILPGVVLSIIGALPFGLVNLSVLNTSYRQGSKPAMRIAYGAALVEILFGLSALIAGSYIMELTGGSKLAKILVVTIPALTGLIFLLKGNKVITISHDKKKGFLKGVFLNLISIQVLMYWLFAIAFLNAKHVVIEPALYLSFGIGIWAGKILVLFSYAKLSTFILSKSEAIASNINRIIGSVLIMTAFIQLIK
jgi:threonine/homoserine/homoserine lactone efflux protein